MSTHYVYVIAHNDGTQLRGPVKIGITSSLGARLAGIQTGNPKPLAVAHVFSFADRNHAVKIERQFHEDHYESRLSGEWFDITPFDALEGLCNVVVTGVEELPIGDAERKAVLQWSGYPDSIKTVCDFYGWEPKQ